MPDVVTADNMIAKLVEGIGLYEVGSDGYLLAKQSTVKLVFRGRQEVLPAASHSNADVEEAVSRLF